MHLDDDIVHRILLSVEFKERHALARVSKQFSYILSSRADMWENDAEFVVSHTHTIKLCVRWMRTRWFRSLRIFIRYPWQLYNADKDLEACNIFMNFLGAFASRLHHLDISVPYHINLQQYAPFVNMCTSLRSLRMYVYEMHRDLDFNNLTCLETLSIESYMPIRVVTECTLHSLTSLEMKSKSSSIAIDNMNVPNLKRFSLEGAHFAHLPANLGELTSLTSLSFQRCNLIHLPSYMSTLTTLRHLRISRNSLMSIENLPPNLVLLDASHNMCVEFDAIHTRLEILDISCNPYISRLETLNLPNLKSVSCSAIPTQTFLSKSKHLQTIHIHDACRGYRLTNPPSQPISRGPTTTATRLFLDAEIYDARDASAELVDFFHTNPHMQIMSS
jgi:hypothetical protein